MDLGAIRATLLRPDESHETKLKALTGLTEVKWTVGDMFASGLGPVVKHLAQDKQYQTIASAILAKWTQMLATPRAKLATASYEKLRSVGLSNADAAHIESSVYERHGNNVHMYTQRIGLVAWLVRAFPKVTTPPMPAQNWKTLTDEQADKLCEAVCEAMVQRRRDAAEDRNSAPKATPTDRFQCGKCKKWRTEFYTMQTRRFDEPPTAFITCLLCKHKWTE